MSERAAFASRASAPVPCLVFGAAEMAIDADREAVAETRLAFPEAPAMQTHDRVHENALGLDDVRCGRTSKYGMNEQYKYKLKLL